MDIGVEKGGRVRLPFNVKNDCQTPQTWKVRLKNLGPATLSKPQPISVPAKATAGVDILLDFSMTDKRKIKGKILMECITCRTCRADRMRFRLRVAIFDFEPIKARAEAFVKEAGLPIRPTGVRLVDPRGDDDVGWKIGMQDEMADVERRKLLVSQFLESTLQALKLSSNVTGRRSDAEETAVLTTEVLVSEMLKLIHNGQYLAEVSWLHDEGQTFTTLAIVEGDGEITFEPILYFNAVERVEGPIGARASLLSGFGESGDWEPTGLSLAADLASGQNRNRDSGNEVAKQYRVKRVEKGWKGEGGWQLVNGFGTVCSEAEWTVDIKTRECRIVNRKSLYCGPGKTPCPLWFTKRVKCSEEEKYCTDGNDNCSPDCGQEDEECIEWGVGWKILMGPFGVFGSDTAPQSEFNHGNLCALTGDHLERK